MPSSLSTPPSTTAGRRGVLTGPGPRLARAAARVGAATALVAGAALAGTSAAQAHVHASADSTAAGSFSAVTFRVPNESDTAGTVKVQVLLPQDTPLLYVSSKPVAGWTVATVEAPLPAPVEVAGTTITEAARTVTWTADKGVQIRPGEYEEFSISVGPLPQPGTIVLPTRQTYSDGTVVAWDETTPASGEEPEHPAPELVVTTAETAEGHGGDGQAEGPAAGQAPDQDTATAAGGSDPVARGLGGGALVLAAAAVVLAGLGLRRRDGAATDA